MLYLKKIEGENKGKEALYKQIAQSLKQAITGNQLPPGSLIPSENALCEYYDVSRSVVRQALAMLADGGYILKQAGKASVVAPRVKHRRNLKNSLSLHSQLESKGVKLQTEILRFEKGRFPDEVASFYGAAEGLLLERIRSINEEPISYVETWLPMEFSTLTSSDLANESLHQQLFERFYRKPEQGRNQIQIVSANKRLASCLQVRPKSPLLQLQASYYDQNGMPLEWFTAWHREDKVVFDIAVDASLENTIQVKNFQRMLK